VVFGRSGSLLAVGNSGDGTVSVFSVSSAGWLTPVAGSPFATGSNLYSLAFSPSGGLLAVANQGDPGKPGSLSVFSVDSSGALAQVSGSPFTIGAGLVSLAFSPSGGLLAVGSAAGVQVFSVKSDGTLTPVAGSPFAAGNGFMAFSPSGGFLAVNGPNFSSGGSVAVFSVDSSGALTQVPGSPFSAGKNSFPGSVAFSPSGGLLATANPGQRTVSVLSVDSSTGALTPVAGSPFTTAAGLVSLAFSPSGGLLATTNTDDGPSPPQVLYHSTVSLFSVNSDGTLTPVAGSPFAEGALTYPDSVAFSPSGGLMAVANLSAHSVSMFAISNSDATGPSVQITSPSNGAKYTVGQLVNATFGCTEGAGGPGLASCAGDVPSGAEINTATPGPQTFTVTGTSSDGQHATSTADYTVIEPSNRITVSHIKTDTEGTISFQARVPTEGTLDVLETAWYATRARRASVLQPAHRFASGHANAVATAAGVLHLSVGFSAEGRRLVRRRGHAVVLKLWVTYTPNGGNPRTVGFDGLRPGGKGTMGARPIVSTVKGKPKPARCTAAQHPATMLAVGATLIYGVVGSNSDGNTVTKYHACQSPYGRAVPLGTDSPVDSEYGPDGTTSGFAIAGDFAAAHVSYGESDQVQCGKAQQPSCPLPRAWIAMVNVRTLRHATIPVPYTSPSPWLGLPVQDEVPLAISPGGGVAWLQPDFVPEDKFLVGGAALPGIPPLDWAESENWATEGDQLWATMLVPQGPSGFSSSPMMIDSGNIPASSIRFLNANTLTWSNGDIVHKQSIG
jgi:6-phosphogluconolactonase (cycloisomerase 2 family)